MAYADGNRVMGRVELLIKSIYTYFATKPWGFIEKSLPESPFIRVLYEEAMSKHGSDKPDLRIKGLVSSLLIHKDYD
jgi:aspartyl-tRNA synthetase